MTEQDHEGQAGAAREFEPSLDTAELEAAPDSQEKDTDPEDLWNDPEVVSLSLRRHSSYERDRGSIMRGALDHEGIMAAKEVAQEWAEQVPEGAEVSIYQSPSFMPAAERTHAATGEPIRARAKRASITASVYEQAVFGDQQVSRDEAGRVIRNEMGEPVPARRAALTELGDLLETSTSPESVDKFFAVLSETYGGLTSDFWRDYARDALDQRVAEALEAAGGADSIQLASNVLDFVTKTASELAASVVIPGTKNVGLAVTHGETIMAFAWNLAKYLESEMQGGARFKELVEADFSYNEGIDVHMSGDRMTTVIERGSDRAEVSFAVDGFREYLQSLRELKNER